MTILDGITRKWRFYRNTLVVCFFLNVLCVITGMCLGVDYWHSALKREALQTQFFDKLEAADRLDIAIQNLQAPSKKDATYEFANWSDVKIELQAIGAAPLPLEALASVDSKSKYLSSLSSEIRSQKAKWLSEWRKSEKRDSHVVRLLILASVLSLLFGLLLPLYYFARIAKILVRTKDDLQKAAQNIVGEWLKAADRFGEEPFRNIEFWLHMVLIAAAYLGESSRHPAAQVAGELASLVRRELKKNGVSP